jgi:t-SNARE complex subunit (syntaxin)
VTNQQHRYTGAGDDPGAGKAPLTARQRRNRLLVILIVIAIIVAMIVLHIVGVVGKGTM